MNIFTLQKKIFGFMAGALTRTSCRSLFKQLEIFLVPCQFILSLMDLIVSHQENFQIQLYIIFIQGISTIFIDQMSICLVLKRHQNFQYFTTQAYISQEWQGKIQSSTKKILKYTVLLLCRYIFYVWRWCIRLFYKMFVVFYTKNCVYLHIYDLFHILLSLWHTFGSMDCTYVRMCVWTACPVNSMGMCQWMILQYNMSNSVGND